ncbi:MAG: hypothetical protein WBB01_19875 [Phormidesmis sp.]
MSYLRGDTVIYGTVVDVVGTGVQKPVIHLRLIESDKDDCPMDCPADSETAIAVSQRIGQAVGLVGTAEWDIETFELKAFEAEGLSEYEQTTLSEAFRAISEKYGESIDFQPRR